MKVRTDAYHRALTDNPSLLKGAVVMDVGCGTGILRCDNILVVTDAVSIFLSCVLCAIFFFMPLFFFMLIYAFKKWGKKENMESH